jgi:hypothetical protein
MYERVIFLTFALINQNLSCATSLGSTQDQRASNMRPSLYPSLTNPLR